MDEKFFEHAEQIEQRTRDNAIAAAAIANQPERHPEFDGESCVDCGTEIPEKRLALGKVRCVYCQSKRERSAYAYTGK